MPLTEEERKQREKLQKLYDEFENKETNPAKATQMLIEKLNDKEKSKPTKSAQSVARANGGGSKRSWRKTKTAKKKAHNKTSSLDNLALYRVKSFYLKASDKGEMPGRFSGKGRGRSRTRIKKRKRKSRLTKKVKKRRNK